MPAVATAGGLPTRLGKYEILTPLAAGGMARIYIARTTGIGSFERHVVLKLITPERANDHTAVQMFLDEARLAAALNHQNVAQVFEVGEDAGIHYLAMEYVHGQDLRALLAKAGSQGTRVPLELALTTVAGAAAGLNHAHERRDGNGVPLGIVHRDVSPSNIMIGLDGSVKLLDFGIAKATARSVETVSGIIKGKFAYMAPEQCRGRDVDRRSDVFSLGIILYEITTQHRCFRADSDFDTMHRIVTGDVVRPTRLVQGYPQALEAIVMKALAIDANQRYQSAGLLLEAIEAFAVAARMSLSTMALGRFMREMFGEAPEPWLQGGRGSGPMLASPKESTISNTNGQSGAHAQRAPSEAPVEQVAARTLLDLPRDHEDRSEAGDDFDSDAAEWNAKSYPTMVPGSFASSETLPPDLSMKAGKASSPQLPALQAPVHAPQSPAASGARALDHNGSGQFPMHPGSDSHRSHPSHPALPALKIPGQSGQSFAMSEESLANVRVRPNRRPLWIGLFIIMVGVGVVLFVGYGGSSLEPKPEDPKPTNPVLNLADAAVPVADNIHIELSSEPSNAEVYLAGKMIGKTPLDHKQARGTGSVSLVVKHAGFENTTLKVDLGGDYSKKVMLVAEASEPVMPTSGVKPENPPVNPTTDGDKPPVKPTTDGDKPPVKPTTDGDKPPVKPTTDKPPIKPPVKPEKPPIKPPAKPDKPPAPVKVDCQIPGQQMPFDSRPICKT